MVETTLSQNIFYITPEPRMPEIVASAKVVGVEPDPTATAQFRWTFTISYTAPPPFSRTVKIDLPPVLGGATHQPVFPAIRGGKLTAHATLVRGVTDCAVSRNYAEIRGLDPSFAAVKAFLGNDLLARMACHESIGQLQFENLIKKRNGQPLIEWGGGTGVGMMQITNPPASDDAFWNWKRNLQEGMNIYAGKIKAADAYYKRMRNLKPPAPALSEEQQLQNRVTAYNSGFYWEYKGGKWIEVAKLQPWPKCKGKPKNHKLPNGELCEPYYIKVMKATSCK